MRPKKSSHGYLGAAIKHCKTLKDRLLRCTKVHLIFMCRNSALSYVEESVERRKILSGTGIRTRFLALRADALSTKSHRISTPMPD
ncbi:hypothetical protein ANN_04217 [Periplaneta americana]|uniref:Uncharacterized protein n=1 Tax=Periplaneta americana TaxID=6978 RepID=A0ABQ8T8P3_PERAM|nr:hypothetical protein ANN_04217 [Periplaneta americana]